MDVLYGNDRKLGDFDDSDMADMLENDMFHTSTSMSIDNLESELWLDNLFGLDPCMLTDKVLNDKSLTEAAQPPCIKSEHSYSLNNDQTPASPLGFAKLEDFENDLFCNVAMDLSHKTSMSSNSPSHIKQESMEFELTLAASTASTTRSTPVCLSSTPRQPTLILATQSLSPSFCDSSLDCGSAGISNIIIKQEPPDTYDQNSSDQIVNVDSVSNGLPPTPPSSTGSDSDGSLSPSRSAPSSPIRSPTSRHPSSVSSALSQISSKALSHQPLFVSPIPQSGILILSDEEKRTLVSEGYPIPQKLPLTKQEEKNLKKIRRKIKNKISAQESRRKKKEYLEALEKKCEAFTHENSDLKKRVDSLESNNRSLLTQLRNLQAMVSNKMPRPLVASATQTGTVVMVLVLSFAVFLGGWAPSLSIGYSSTAHSVGAIFNKPNIIHPAPSIGPHVGRASVAEEYDTPNLKSRVLLSIKDEEDWEGEDQWPPSPWSFASVCTLDNPQPTVSNTEPSTPIASVAGPATEFPKHEGSPSIRDRPNQHPVVTKTVAPNNKTQEEWEYQATMHPDIAVASLETRGKIPADIETA